VGLVQGKHLSVDGGFVVAASSRGSVSPRFLGQAIPEASKSEVWLWLSLFCRRRRLISSRSSSKSGYSEVKTSAEPHPANQRDFFNTNTRLQVTWGFSFTPLVVLDAGKAYDGGYLRL
jgi:hypothetical protein